MIYNKCMDYLRRRSRFKQIKYKLKQTADRFSDDEFEALCHKELFRIIIFLIIHQLGISRSRKSRIIPFPGDPSGPGSLPRSTDFRITHCISNA